MMRPRSSSTRTSLSSRFARGLEKSLGGGIEEGSDLSASLEPRLHERLRSFAIAVEQTNAHGKDHVETSVAEVEILEVPNEELGLPGLDERRVPSTGSLDHLRRAVDRRQPAVDEPLADHRRRNSMSTADLEDAVAGTNAELVDDPLQALAQM
jgi:hypothetical protein